MRVTIKADCVDIVTNDAYYVGDVVDIPDDRAIKAIERGLAESIAEPEKKPTRKRTTKKK